MRCVKGIYFFLAGGSQRFAENYTTVRWGEAKWRRAKVDAIFLDTWTLGHTRLSTWHIRRSTSVCMSCIVAMRRFLAGTGFSLSSVLLEAWLMCRLGGLGAGQRAAVKVVGRGALCLCSGLAPGTCSFFLRACVRTISANLNLNVSSPPSYYERTHIGRKIVTCSTSLLFIPPVYRVILLTFPVLPGLL